MRIKIKVIPRAHKNEVIKLDEENYKARLTTPPVDGKANEALVDLLSDYFNISKNKIIILKGEKCREKVIDINL